MNRTVEVAVEKTVWESSRVFLHPLVNTATLALPTEGVRKVLAQTGHQPIVLSPR